MSKVVARASAGEATGREFLLLVTALMAMTAVGIDLMLPAFPDMRAEFGMASDSTRVALTVTTYFLGMAVGPWFFGPISDRTGRRGPLFIGLALYASASMVAARTGPSSLTRVTLITAPIRVSSPISRNEWYDCTASTMPMKQPGMPTTIVLATPML